MARMTVEMIRERLLRTIKGLENLCEELSDDRDVSEKVLEELRIRLQTLIYAYNLTFRSMDKRVKRWKCKICGQVAEGVLKPMWKVHYPQEHWCEFEPIKRDEAYQQACFNG